MNRDGKELEAPGGHLPALTQAKEGAKHRSDTWYSRLTADPACFLLFKLIFDSRVFIAIVRNPQILRHCTQEKLRSEKTRLSTHTTSYSSNSA